MFGSTPEAEEFGVAVAAERSRSAFRAEGRGGSGGRGAPEPALRLAGNGRRGRGRDRCARGGTADDDSRRLRMPVDGAGGADLERARRPPRVKLPAPRARRRRSSCGGAAPTARAPARRRPPRPDPRAREQGCAARGPRAPRPAASCRCRARRRPARECRVPRARSRARRATWRLPTFGPRSPLRRSRSRSENRTTGEVSRANRMGRARATVAVGRGCTRLTSPCFARQTGQTRSTPASPSTSLIPTQRDGLTRRITVPSTR